MISAGPGEWRAALVEDGAAVELYVERGEWRPAGSIHLGRVVRLAPGLESAFVEIGEARPGILPVREAASAGLALGEGAALAVEVRREAQPGKGARLSARLSREVSAAGAEPPAQLYPAPGLAAALALRLPGPPGRIAVDDAAAVTELRTAFPDSEVAVEPLEIDLDATFDAALAPRLAIDDATVLHVVETETAVLIDVDSAAGQAGNRAAVAAIARQIRLRNLGGGIVVDFVGLDRRGARERLSRAFAEALAADPAQPRVLGWTRLGRLELVRPRRARSLAAALLEPGEPAPSPASSAFAALRALAARARAEPAVAWKIVAAPAVAAALDGVAAAGRRALADRLGRPVAVEIRRAEPAAAFDIAAP